VLDLIFHHYDAEAAQAIRDTVALIHHEAYAAAIERGDPFESGDEPMRRFDAYTRRGGFDLVVAYLDDEPTGQAWGWPLDPDTTWWHGLVSDVEPGFTEEDGTRTFAFSELMVRRRWAGKGVGHALHNELLAPRTEKRATLLVRPENTTAYRAYTRWGWQKAAELRPAVPHAPLMHVLMLDLPVTR
jgi:GNAT superfamily N-acetyltransferase